MSSPVSPVVAITENESHDVNITTALPPSDEPQPSRSLADVEACGPETVTIVQGRNVISRGARRAILVLRRILHSAWTLILSLTLFWRERKLDEFWGALPERNIYDRDGIPRLAAFMNSNANFCVWRSFGQLHTRVLLQRMLELDELEAELNRLDTQDSLDVTKRYRLRTALHYEGCDSSQKDLIQKISLKLSEYSDLLLKHHAMKNISKPSKSNWESVRNWICSKKPIEETHYNFIFRVEDFIRLGPSDQNDAFHDGILRWISDDRWSGSPLNKYLRDQGKTQDISLQYYSASRLGLLAKGFIILLVISILMVPILILYMVPMSQGLKAVVVLMALFTFAASLSLFRDSKPQDVFFGTATYCAVLLVFLATNGNNSTTVAMPTST